jgi:serine/threonine-protein kinase
MTDLEQGQPSQEGAPLSTPSTSKQERARLAREALIGKTIAGRYVLRSLLGAGGMGAVYEAEHLGIGKRVAIKFVDQEWITDEQVLTRFAREARAMSAIESPHIVQIFDAGTEDGRPFLVMELLRGEDLGQRLRRANKVALTEALHIIAMVLKGLSKAHAAGIVHRDLKPDNIFLVQMDADPVFAKIVDFGVSKIERPKNRTSPLALTGRGTVLGTPFYMSPEQAQAAADLDGRADIFSVGTILFECLAGRPPHTGETYEQIILAICMRDAPNLQKLDPTIPEPVAALVAKALSRDRANRFESADVMLAALHELSPEEKKRVPAEPPPNLNKTLAVGTAPPNMPTPTPASVKPFKGASTQIAGSESTGPAMPVAALPAVAGSVIPATKPSATLGNSSPEMPIVVPTSKPTALLVTALIATVLGIAATFGLIAVMGRKPDIPAPQPAPLVPAVASTPSAAPVVLPSAVPVVASSAPPLVTAAPPPAPKPKPAPKPSSKSLDINRDLP